MHLLNSKLLSRRTLLRAGAVTVGLPLLDAMLPAGFAAEQKAAALHPRRMVLIGRQLGTVEEHFFPKTTGLNYEATRYLKALEPHRGKFTVFSGMSHLGYPNSHHTWAGLLTGVEPSRIQRGDDVRNTISLDQFIADRFRGQTREAFLAMGQDSSEALSYNRDGVVVPSEQSHTRMFQRLFIDGKPEDVEREIRRLRDGQSILDGVRDQFRDLQKTLGAGDRNRLDLLGTSIREAEQQLQLDEAWIRKSKPVVARKLEDYQNPSWSDQQRLWYDLAYLTLETDITRVVVVVEQQGGAGGAPGTTIHQHDASHHGQEPTKLEQLALYEEEEIRNVGLLLNQLAGSKTATGTLLDDTMVFWGSNIGNASAHASNNLPIMVAGGGFKHQGHVAFDLGKNYPLSNLYVRMLHQIGIAADKFGSSTGALSEIG